MLNHTCSLVPPPAVGSAPEPHSAGSGGAALGHEAAPRLTDFSSASSLRPSGDAQNRHSGVLAALSPLHQMWSHGRAGRF